MTTAATGAAPREQAPAPFPESVWRILGTELGERFSYYSLRAVLALYFVSLGLTEGSAVALFSYTSALAYFMPLFGGVLADVWWGRYRTILVFSSIYVLGAVALAAHAASGGAGGVGGALVALALISVGTGGIKPCVSAFGADQLADGGGADEASDAARGRYFATFYMSINIGSMMAFVLAPLLRATLGFSAAFAAAAAVLAAALAAFAGGRASYRHPAPSASFYRALASHLATSVASSLPGRRRRHHGGGGSGGTATAAATGAAAAAARAARQSYGQLEGTVLGKPEDVESAALSESKRLAKADSVADALAALRQLVPVLLLLPCFWALFDQQGSSWVLQAKAMRLKGLLPFGVELAPESLLVLNPVLVTVLVPLAARLFERWPRLFGGQPAPPATTRMFVGMLIASLAFVCSAAVQALVSSSPAGAVSVLWQVPQLFFITLAEVLVSVESLNFFYAKAPAEAKAAVSALALMTVSLGDVLCGVLYQALSPLLSPTALLLTFAGLMAVNAAVFFRVTCASAATLDPGAGVVTVGAE